MRGLGSGGGRARAARLRFGGLALLRGRRALLNTIGRPLKVVRVHLSKRRARYDDCDEHAYKAWAFCDTARGSCDYHCPKNTSQMIAKARTTRPVLTISTVRTVGPRSACRASRAVSTICSPCLAAMLRSLRYEKATRAAPRLFRGCTEFEDELSRLPARGTSEAEGATRSVAITRQVLHPGPHPCGW